MAESLIPPIRLMEYITPHSMGGAEHGIMVEGAELTRRGHQVVIVCPRGWELTGVMRRRGFHVWSPRTFGKVDPVTLLRLAGAIRAGGAQLIHTHLSTASLLGSLAARLGGVPSVATVHGLNTAFCYRFATRIIAISEAVRTHLMAQGIPASRIEVVYNGINTDNFITIPDRDEARRTLGFHPDDQVVLYAGRLSGEKGVTLLPEVLEHL